MGIAFPWLRQLVVVLITLTPSPGFLNPLSQQMGMPDCT